MKKLYIIIPFLLVLFCCSCHDTKEISLGTAEYYPGFLWIKEKTTPFVRTFNFDFSQDAKNDKGSYAEFMLVDNDDKQIPADLLHISINGKMLNENRFKVKSGTSSLTLTFSFTPKAKSGKWQGYLRLVDHNLDRIDSQPLVKGQKMDVLQWQMYFDKQMNPLAKVIMWLCILLLSILLIWFVFLRPMIYPHFGKMRKSVILEKNGKIVGQCNVVFTGARHVRFSQKVQKQSIFKRLFVGKITTYKNPIFSENLEFSPKGKKALAFGRGYMVTPNPFPRSGIVTIENRQQVLKITLR